MIEGYVKLLIMVVAVSVGQILTKMGTKRIRTREGRLVWSSFINLPLIAGGGIGLFMPLLYFSALEKLPLSTAYGFTGFTYVLVFILARLVLKEKITIFHSAGILFILGGFILWNL